LDLPLEKQNIRLTGDVDEEKFRQFMVSGSVKGLNITPNNQPIDTQNPLANTLSQLQNPVLPNSTLNASKLKANNQNQKATGMPLITPSEVSQSTAISDRPKAKAISKKDSKNRKQNIWSVLQQSPMVRVDHILL